MLKILRIFRYVDNYLALYEFGSNNTETLTNVMSMFRKCLDKLVVTHEVPVDNVIQTSN